MRNNNSVLNEIIVLNLGFRVRNYFNENFKNILLPYVGVDIFYFCSQMTL